MIDYFLVFGFFKIVPFFSFLDAPILISSFYWIMPRFLDYAAFSDYHDMRIENPKTQHNPTEILAHVFFFFFFFARPSMVPCFQFSSYEIGIPPVSIQHVGNLFGRQFAILFVHRQIFILADAHSAVASRLWWCARENRACKSRLDIFRQMKITNMKPVVRALSTSKFNVLSSVWPPCNCAYVSSSVGCLIECTLE